jgi:hypothetical protein
MFDLVKARFGKKYYIKVIKVAKDYGWRNTLASLTIQVWVFPPQEIERGTEGALDFRFVLYFSVSELIPSQKSPSPLVMMYLKLDSLLRSLWRLMLSRSISQGFCRYKQSAMFRDKLGLVTGISDGD